MGIMSVTEAMGKKSSQPWNLSAELEWRDTGGAPKEHSVRFLRIKSNCSSSEVAGTAHTIFSFQFNSVKPISLTRAVSLAKIKCNSATQQKVGLVANGFSPIGRNPEPIDVHGKTPISFSGARISPACVHRRKKKNSAANFSEAEKILHRALWLEDNSLGTYTFCYEPRQN